MANLGLDAGKFYFRVLKSKQKLPRLSRERPENCVARVFFNNISIFNNKI